MKRVTVKAIVHDDVDRSTFEWAVKGAGEIEKYTEKEVPKDKDIIDEYSFDSLWESALEFGTGIWSATKGFIGMAKWSIVLIISGLKYLWNNGAGKEKEKDKKDAKAPVKMAPKAGGLDTYK